MRGSLLLLTSALALANCSQATDANVATVVNTDNDTVTVPTGAPAAAANEAAPAAAMPAVNLTPDGLSLVADTGKTNHLTFDSDRGDILPILIKVLGAPADQGTNPECGAGPLDHVKFKGGMTAYFQQAKFVGWNLDGREGGKWTTMTGIGIGSTRAQLEAAGPVELPESTIGHEFIAGGLSGLLSDTRPTGKVTNLWAGTNCIFR